LALSTLDGFAKSRFYSLLEQDTFYESVKPPRPPGRGFASRAYAPGKEDCHFCIAPLDPALSGGACGEQAGQSVRYSIPTILIFGRPKDRRYFSSADRSSRRCRL